MSSAWRLLANTRMRLMAQLSVRNGFITPSALKTNLCWVSCRLESWRKDADSCESGKSIEHRFHFGQPQVFFAAACLRPPSDDVFGEAFGDAFGEPAGRARDRGEPRGEDAGGGEAAATESGRGAAASKVNACCCECVFVVRSVGLRSDSVTVVRAMAAFGDPAGRFVGECNVALERSQSESNCAEDRSSSRFLISFSVIHRPSDSERVWMIDFDRSPIVRMTDSRRMPF